jgi:hypothetical protein
VRSLLIFAIVAFCHVAIEIKAYAEITGFLVYTPISDGDDSKTKVIAFSEIFWQSAEGGSITNLSGSSAQFNNTDIAQFVFLDEDYWRSIANNSSYTQFRIKINEVVIPANRLTITTDSDIHPFVTARACLQNKVCSI